MCNKILTARKQIKKYFNERNAILDEVVESHSPCGNYFYTLTPYRQEKPGVNWTVSKIELFQNINHQKIFECIKEDDTDNLYWLYLASRDYLFFSETLTGQSVFDLTERMFYSFASKEDEFIWCSYYPAPDRSKLAIEGCYWGSNYGIIVYDITNPVNLPLSPITSFIPIEGRSITWVDTNTVQLLDKENSQKTSFIRCNERTCRK